MTSIATTQLKRDLAELTDRNLRSPTAVWYFAEGGRSLHNAELVFQASDNLAVFRIRWRKSVEKTLLARFKKVPGGSSDWVELHRPQDRKQAVQGLEASTRSRIQELVPDA